MICLSAAISRSNGRVAPLHPSEGKGLKLMMKRVGRILSLRGEHKSTYVFYLVILSGLFFLIFLGAKVNFYTYIHIIFCFWNFLQGAVSRSASGGHSEKRRRKVERGERRTRTNHVMREMMRNLA